MLWISWNLRTSTCLLTVLISIMKLSIIFSKLDLLLITSRHWKMLCMPKSHCFWDLRNSFWLIVSTSVLEPIIWILLPIFCKRLSNTSCLNKVTFPAIAVNILHYIRCICSFPVQPVRTIAVSRFSPCGDINKFWEIWFNFINRFQSCLSKHGPSPLNLQRQKIWY